MMAGSRPTPANETPEPAVDRQEASEAEHTPPPTASGLDEAQIDPGDLAKLHALFRPHMLLPAVSLNAKQLPAESLQPVQSARNLHMAQLLLPMPRNLKLRFVALPGKIAVRRIAAPPPRLRLHKAIKHALSWPVIRRCQRFEDMPGAAQKALLTALFKRYGVEAKTLEVRAIFAHIPPEAAPHVKLGPNFQAASFIWPEQVPVSKATAGYYLVVLTPPDGKTRNVILRLE